MEFGSLKQLSNLPISQWMLSSLRVNIFRVSDAGELLDAVLVWPLWPVRGPALILLMCGLELTHMRRLFDAAAHPILRYFRITPAYI